MHGCCNTYKFVLVLLVSFLLAGCGKMWSWFDDEDDIVYEEIDIEEEEFEEEVIEEEFEEEPIDEEYNYEEEYPEDSYGDEPEYSETPRSAPAPKRTMIYFDYKQSSVPATGLNILQLHAQYLMTNPQTAVTIEGHTDSVAPPSYNQKLGLKRARAVAEMLINMGVPAKQIEVVSYGEKRPLKSGKGEQVNALNRRVEIVYE